MSEELKADKVFMSYAWSSQSHEDWVMELAERLESSGVEVIIDKWDSIEGQNLNAFMERSITDPTITKVLVICDETYARKADGYEGGVGTETVIISNEVYQDVKQTKFIPIIAQRSIDGKEFLPTYLKGAKYIDMSSKQNYEDGFEKLLRNLYNKPEFTRPKRGQAPSFLLQDEKKVNLKSRIALNRFRHQVERKPRNVDIFIGEFTEVFIEDFASYAITVTDKSELLDKVYDSLYQTLDLRNTYIEFLEFYIRESEIIEAQSIIDFLECIYPVITTKEGDSYFRGQFDHMKFFVTELLLYTMAILFKNRKYSVMRELVQNHYFVSDDILSDIEGTIAIFNPHLELIDGNDIPSLGQKFISNSGKLILDRANYKNIPSDDLVQADFLILFLSFAFNKLKGYFVWSTPTSPFFSSTNIKFIKKLRSRRFFENVKDLFEIEDVSQMVNLVDRFKTFLERGTSGARFVTYQFPETSEIASL
ncbi:toll/interleukin-1 receptor domain-containing protein [Rossellomorea marisflavi]|uniref:toll/interleukin-1 receptor domain-containing protein n=1 Tax=Rossellomorea marisflavi TaxID=189381 RepID=UPI003D2F1C30